MQNQRFFERSYPEGSWKVKNKIWKKTLISAVEVSSLQPLVHTLKSELAKISELRNKWIKNSKNGLLINLFGFSSDFD